MNIARLLYPVRVLGPGKRLGIWVAGCPRRCRGCSNPELWEKKPEYEITIDRLMTIIQSLREKYEIDGFTISGGEPMEQADELIELICGIKPVSSDILVYSGYTMEQMKKKGTAVRRVLDQIAVLIDGEYVEEQNDGSFLRGSSNQRIHLLNPEYQSLYEAYLREGHNQIQNFTTKDGIVSVGIHHKTF